MAEVKSLYGNPVHDAVARAGLNERYTKAESDNRYAFKGETSGDGDTIVEKPYDDTELRGLISGKYSKPSTGIPMSDLASEVQALLNKANNALQAVPDSYATKQWVLDQGYGQGGNGGTAVIPTTENGIVYYTPEMYGAVGNGTTDDSTAIQRAITEAGTQGLVILSGKTYAVRTPIKLSNGYQAFICFGSIKQLANADAVQINSDFNKVFIKNIVSAGNGLTLGNGHVAKCNDIEVTSIYSTGVGVLLNCIPSTPAGSATWMQYNTIKGGYIESKDSAIRLYISPNCPVQTYTWINENRFHNFFCMAQTTAPSVDIDNECSGTVDICNNNRFDDVSVEFSNVATGAFAIRMKNTFANEFRGLRSDELDKYASNQNKLVKFEGICKYNMVNCSLCYENHVDISGATTLQNNQIWPKRAYSPSYLLANGTSVINKTI